MDDKLTQIKVLLGNLGREIERERKPLKITSTADIERHIPTRPGVYWIETTMPVELLRTAIAEVRKKQNSEALKKQNSEVVENKKRVLKMLKEQKKIRLEPPKGANLIHQTNNDSYVVYSGTDDKISERLKQHLFNEGGQGTARLGCVIDERPFSDYEWKVSFREIDSYEIRYAVEAWWRLNIGWPVFCIR